MVRYMYHLTNKYLEINIAIYKTIKEDELKYSILLHRLDGPVRSVSKGRYNVMIT